MQSRSRQGIHSLVDLPFGPSDRPICWTNRRWACRYDGEAWSLMNSGTKLAGRRQRANSALIDRQFMLERSAIIACRHWSCRVRASQSMALKQLHMVVRGRVQGVYFRASAQREARRLGVCGWVRNRADGSLEIVAEGEEAAVRDLHGWAQKGPSAARVDRVDTRWRSYVGEYADFRILD